MFNAFKFFENLKNLLSKEEQEVLKDLENKTGVETSPRLTEAMGKMHTITDVLNKALEFPLSSLEELQP